MFQLAKNPIVRLNNVIAENSKIETGQSVLFIVAGVEGNCHAFNDLAERLGQQNIQVYGLEYTIDVPNDSVQSMAQYYFNIIGEELKSLNTLKFNLAGYSFGGLIAIEMCHQIETSSNSNLFILNLFLFETSHKLFRLGVHSNAKQFGLCIENKDIFRDIRVYAGTLSIYISFMIGKQSKKFKFEIYKYLIEQNVTNLDEALNKAFDYVKSKAYFEFENEMEVCDMKNYLKILLLKSNAGLLYNFDYSKAKLSTNILLIKSKKFLYHDYADDLYFYDDYKNKIKFYFNKQDFGLSEILNDGKNLKVFVCEQGNHWTLINENLEEIANILFNSMNDSFKSKL